MSDRGDKHAQGITSKKIVTITGKGKQNEQFAERTEMAGIEGDTFLEDQIDDLKVCQCGVIMKPSEAKAIDAVTTELICLECSVVQCASCKRRIGVESRVELFEKIYCKRCATRTGIFVLVVCVIVIAVVYFVVFS